MPPRPSSVLFGGVEGVEVDAVGAASRDGRDCSSACLIDDVEKGCVLKHSQVDGLDGIQGLETMSLLLILLLMLNALSGCQWTKNNSPLELPKSRLRDFVNSGGIFR